MALLEVRNLTVSYGGLIANDAIDLDCEAGSLVGLIGPNGAGKTTLIDAITGFASVADGSITLDGRDLAGRPPAARAAMGLARTFQSLELFEDLTVRDNLLAAADRPTWYSFFADLVAPRRHEQRSRDRVAWALDAMQLEAFADQQPSELSHGQRKLVSLARAVVARPGLVLLDEPAAGLDTGESAALGRRLRRLVDDGTSLLLVDHDMSLVLDVCDHVYVLDFGTVIAHGAPADVRANPDVVRAYLGGDPDLAETP
ncbi:MAG: ABC transporter ATP-binding protein [Ilumatobacter sp.]|nr:ABC transporter ATP-binding protein [Ilumatobacter sp.]